MNEASVSEQRPATDTPRYVVTGGGSPTHEQLAALAVALAPVAVDGAEPTGPRIGNWQSAAIREGVGHRTFVAWADLQGGRFPLG